MKEGVCGIVANIKLGHSTEANFVFWEKQIMKQGQLTCPCKILQPSLHQHGDKQPPKTFFAWELSFGLSKNTT